MMSRLSLRSQPVGRRSIRDELCAYQGLEDRIHWVGEMDPIAYQSSIRAPFDGNASEWHGFTLPRSFKHVGRGIRAYEAFYKLLRVYLGPNAPQRENGLKTHSRASQGRILPSYSASLERSLRVQVAGERNAKVLFGIVKGFRMVRENTFFRLGKKRKEKGFREVALETYTLLDLIAITRAQEKTSIKGTE